MNSKWNAAFTSISRSSPPINTEQVAKRRIVPDKVYNIGNTIEIIVNTSTQPRQEVTLKYRQHKPIRFTIEEFTKFANFVFKFMIDDNNDEEDFVYGFMDCEVPKWFDFVIGKYIFLSCWHDGNSYGLAIQDTNNNNDYVTWNKNEIALFKTHKYKLYDFLK
ncbi:hypothetical protein ABEB36_012817 [Hypothenemus hampei]|uniref:Uncharacterized protein n=1 Tax=Hypothenemus hampei TaxID=57062 RepID=A0ABD1E5W4_HYPHA